ncbi:MAG: HAD family hydrolase, partial [Paracoccaceae bacterium]
RKLTTAIKYSFAARGDCAVLDEPFYAAYLTQTGLEHPMRRDVIASQSSDPSEVARLCLGPNPQGQSLFYQKHMTLHMLPDWDLGFLRQLSNVFLIRHPARVVASYAKKRETPTLSDIGFVQQAALFDHVADFFGHAPMVVDSADVRADPKGTLTRLCLALGIAFTERMLSWPVGPKLYDGIWAPHWYGEVHKSTGFGAAEADLPKLSADFQRLSDAALPSYEHLLHHKL